MRRGRALRRRYGHTARTRAAWLNQLSNLAAEHGLSFFEADALPIRYNARGEILSAKEALDKLVRAGKTF